MSGLSVTESCTTATDCLASFPIRMWLPRTLKVRRVGYHWHGLCTEVSTNCHIAYFVPPRSPPPFNPVVRTN